MTKSPEVKVFESGEIYKPEISLPLSSYENESAWFLRNFLNLETIKKEKEGGLEIVMSQQMSLSFLPEHKIKIVTKNKKDIEDEESDELKAFKKMLEKHSSESHIKFVGFNYLNKYGLPYDSKGQVNVFAQFKFINTELQEAYSKMIYDLLDLGKIPGINRETFSPEMSVHFCIINKAQPKSIHDLMGQILRQGSVLKLDFYPRFVSQFGKE